MQEGDTDERHIQNSMYAHILSRITAARVCEEEWSVTAKDRTLGQEKGWGRRTDAKEKETCVLHFVEGWSR